MEARNKNPKKTIPFLPYQKLVIALLAVTQFTIILDFMVISPLGDFLMKSLDLQPDQFGLVVIYGITSATAWAAGL